MTFFIPLVKTRQGDLGDIFRKPPTMLGWFLKRERRNSPYAVNLQ